MNAVAGKPKRRTQAERSHEMRERIINAAIDVLRTKGYEGFRVADVTEAAGISRGAQSHHFPAKSDLVLAIFSRVFEKSTTQSKERIANFKENEDILSAMINDCVEFFLGKDFAMGIDLLGAAGRNPDLQESVQEFARLNRVQVESMWIALLMSRGLSSEDAEDLLWVVFSSIRGLSVRRLWEKDDARIERMKKLMYEVAVDFFNKKTRKK